LKRLLFAIAASSVIAFSASASSGIDVGRPGAKTASGQTTSSQDFESRYDRVRYDTSTFGGMTLSGSFGAKDATREVSEFALRYGGKGAFGEIAAALGFSSQDAATPGWQKD
jgi:hypothetical protein